jgi:hypothetical protein
MEMILEMSLVSMNPTEDQFRQYRQAEPLPVGDRFETEEGWHQPVPQ